MQKLRLLSLFVCAVVGPLSADAVAQTAAVAPAASAAPKPESPPRKKFNPYASPLEVMMDFRLWNNPPPAQDFVKESRPDPKTLDYVPLTGKEPQRPTPRDKKGVEDLRAELEKDMQTNADKGKAVTDKMRADAAAANPAPPPKKVAHKRKKAAAPAQ